MVPAIIFQDNLYQAITRGRIDPVFCPELRDEVTRALEHMLLHRVLTEQERYAYRGLWAVIEARSGHIGPMPPHYTVPELGNHQKDAHLFWTCERGRAAVIITTEKRLWEDLRKWRGVPILKPTDALEWLANRAPER